MRKQFTVAAILATTLGLSGGDAQANTFGPNLLKNGNAEAGIGSPSCNTVPIPGWHVNGSFTVGTYGGRTDVISSNDAGPPSVGANNRGSNFFCGGNGPSSSASQTIDLSSSAKSIDSGQAKYNLSGWLGGFQTDDDNATLVAIFKDNRGTPIKNVFLGPVKAADRRNRTSLIFKQDTGQIPQGTRSVTVTLNTQRTAGLLLDAYADNLSFRIAKPRTVTTATTSGTGTTTSQRPRSNAGAFWGTFLNTLITGGSGLGTPGGSGSLGTGGLGTAGGSGGLGTAGGSGGLGTAGGSGGLGTTGGIGTSVTGTIGGSGGTPSSTGVSSGSSGFLEVTRSPGKTIATIDSKALFNTGSGVLKSTSTNTLRRIRNLKELSQSGKRIIFAAHTDESALDRRNLNLSTMRALAVADWMARHGLVASNVEVRGFGKPKVQSSGSMAGNKRVEIIVLDPPRATNIAGRWKSNFGPLTLFKSGSSITGHWSQSPGRVGQILGGTFDPTTNKLTLRYTKSWDGAHGVVKFTGNGPNSFSGKFNEMDRLGSSRTGSWVITR